MIVTLDLRDNPYFVFTIIVKKLVNLLIMFLEKVVGVRNKKSPTKERKLMTLILKLTPQKKNLHVKKSFNLITEETESSNVTLSTKEEEIQICLG